MKKLLATLAASAVAVSMFAFAGCGDNKDKEPSGAIPGNYEQKDPNEMGSLITDFFKPADGTGDNNNDESNTDKATANMGFKVDLVGSIYSDGIIDYSESIKADIKENTTDKGIIGAGTASVKMNGKVLPSLAQIPSDDPMTMLEVVNVDVNGTAYMDGSFLYAGASGSIGAYDEVAGFDTITVPADAKVKINLNTIMEIVNTIVGEGSKAPDQSTSPFAEEATGSSAEMLASLLQMADEYGVKVGIDVSNGMKIKISADENTVWTTATKVLIEENGMTKAEAEQMVTAVKGYVTMNKFAVDIYAAFDNSKAVTGASVVMDIDVTVNMGIITIIQGAMPTADAEAMPDIAVKQSGSIELYSHNDTVNVPANLATDTTYVDRTEEFIDILEDMVSEIM